MKKFLLLYTKNVHFTFENNVFQQEDRLTTGCSLGLVLAGIFILELEMDLIPKLS